MNDTRAKVVICIFLMVATFCIYSQVKDHEFINFDDDLYITNNLNVQAGLTSKSIKWAFTTSHTPLESYDLAFTFNRLPTLWITSKMSLLDQFTLSYS